MKSLINKLKMMNYRISVAESCTGGLVSKMITDISGASAVFDCGVTTYSNEMKIKLLGVSAETLEKYGAVSEQTAKEMAIGSKTLANSDIAVSVTGIAGPNNDGSKKPVGTVCIGIATNERCYATTFVFAGSRSEVRRLSAKMALRMALEELGGVAKTPIKEKKITKKAASAAKKTKKAIGKLIKKEKSEKNT